MKITAENYEQWALDYLEGTLPSEQRAAFEHFLQNHAREAAEIRSLQDFMPVAQADPIVFPDKAALRRGADATPLRRFVSLVSGAAAAALIAGSFMWLDRSSSAPMQALGPAAVSDSSAVPTNVWVAEAAASESVPPQEISQPVRTATTPSSEAPVAISEEVRSVQGANSRVARWNRKTAALLERMEARNERRMVQVAEQTDPKSALAVREQPVPAVTVAEVQTPSKSPTTSDDKTIYENIFRMDEPESKTLAYENLAEESLKSSLPEMAALEWQGTEESVLARDSLSMGDSFEMQQLRSRRERGLLHALLSPLEKISPIKYYETEEGRGVEIASILRIGSRNR